MSSPSINVVAGSGVNREVVGTVPAQVGLLTSGGRIERTTPTTVILKDGRCIRNTSVLTVRHSEAVRVGYPAADGSNRFKVRDIRRRGQTISA